MRSIVDSSSSPSLSSLLSPPPPPPFLSLLHSSTTDSNSPPSSSYKPSFIIIISIIASVILVSAVIHLLLRLLSHRHPSSPSSSSSSTTTTFNFFSPPPLLNPQPLSNDRKALIDSLPLFSLADSTVPRRSADCAVCLSHLAPHEELRLLPACAHVFHSSCIDTWLRSTPSCPLCRSSVHPPPPPQAVEQSASFRLELGSVSRRRPSDAAGAAANVEEIQQQQSYSLGSSFDYRVEEEVEAVVASLRRSSAVKDEEPGPSSPGQEVVEAAGEGSRGWLRDYVDRLASSASSSFSSLRFSGRWSHRFNVTGSEGGGGDAGPRQSWDLGEEGDYSASFYRWIMGVLS